VEEALHVSGGELQAMVAHAQAFLRARLEEAERVPERAGPTAIRNPRNPEKNAYGVSLFHHHCR